MPDHKITLIPVLSDNYVYLMRWNDEALVVDPPEPGPVLAELTAQGVGLPYILVTHHHSDHVAGVDAIKQAYESQVIGPRDPRVPALDIGVGEGDTIKVGPFTAQVMETPGHTKSHIVYYFKEIGVLFSGDTLFAGGCGRLFEGSPQDMWTSLRKLSALPDDTLIYCGHEYTASNYKFAHTLEPDNEAVAKRLAKVEAMRAEGKPSIPSTMGEEKRTNPFLRAADPSLRKALGMENASDVEVFAEVRRRKDAF